MRGRNRSITMVFDFTRLKPLTLTSSQKVSISLKTFNLQDVKAYNKNDFSLLIFWQMLQTPLSYDLRPTYQLKRAEHKPLTKNLSSKQHKPSKKFELGEDGFSIQKTSCLPPTSFVFHKKHKCASSTLQTVLKNFGRLHGIPREPATFGSVGGGYPGLFNPALRPAPMRTTPGQTIAFIFSLFARMCVL